ncbi:MAG: response regulator [Kineosporiaceae bacterium]|nr:response regulator [Kineosporiaceae bacterium]MBK7621265.1 response regulator [Kineosporiaceae bacterium]MBK8077580.1 response regulator [Kineosporiaceae bacterium]
MTQVLIVDDEPNIVISLDFLMKQQGYTTTTAGDGRAALTEADRVKPDLVLLDITLPELDGFQVCEQLRTGHGDHMKIIMLTARGREAEVAKGLALGANAYLTKPFSTRELVEKVHELLGDG